MKTIDSGHIIIEIFIMVFALYATWENLLNKRISKFGLDALFLVLFEIVDKKQTNTIRKSPVLIRRMGWMMFLIFVGGIYAFMLELT